MFFKSESVRLSLSSLGYGPRSLHRRDVGGRPIALLSIEQSFRALAEAETRNIPIEQFHYHFPGCKPFENIPPSNKWNFSGSAFLFFFENRAKILNERRLERVWNSLCHRDSKPRPSAGP